MNDLYQLEKDLIEYLDSRLKEIKEAKYPASFNAPTTLPIIENTLPFVPLNFTLGLNFILISPPL